jgi:hypothetical protein
MRLAAWVIVLFMALGVVACGGSSSLPSPTASPTESPPPPATRAPTPTPTPNFPTPTPSPTAHPTPTIIPITSLQANQPDASYATGPCVPRFDLPLPTELVIGTKFKITGSCLNGGSINQSGQSVSFSDGYGIGATKWTFTEIDAEILFPGHADARAVDPVIQEVGSNTLMICTSYTNCYETPIKVPNYMTEEYSDIGDTPGLVDFFLTPAPTST